MKDYFWENITRQELLCTVSDFKSFLSIFYFHHKAVFKSRAAYRVWEGEVHPPAEKNVFSAITFDSE
jgi:hypothetical protein